MQPSPQHSGYVEDDILVLQVHFQHSAQQGDDIALDNLQTGGGVFAEAAQCYGQLHQEVGTTGLVGIV